jgi:exopolyphosphatase/guanosine-5'-triphosphate,3'-diphosphate pyrophosphatase
VDAVPTSPADATTTIPPVNVAIIDVGSNSVRLLVAAVDGGLVKQLHRDRVYLRLGDDAYRLGRIGATKLEETSAVAARFARMARKRGAERLETIVTAPGRQSSNRDELVEVLSEATQAPVAVLTANDEGRLAWEGAVSRMDDPPEIVAVVDLGGGSCELAVGTPTLGPAWVRSVDAGALRVTRAFLGGDPPAGERVATARREIRRLVGGFDPPRPDAALAVGGTSRAIGRVFGKRFGADQLERLTSTLSTVPAETVTEAHGITPERAQTLLGGTLVLTEVARRLHSDLEVGRGGLREGAALALAGAEAAAA